MSLATPEKIGKQKLVFVRCSATPNRLLTNKNASLTFGVSWRVLAERPQNPAWQQILNNARTIFEENE